jgi:putative phosphoribosyl transferase
VRREYGATELYEDRRDAGRRLAARLEPLKAEAPVVVGLPRGGVPVAYEIAATLDAPMDIIVVRKLGAPFQHELGLGALAEGGVGVVNEPLVRAVHLTEDELHEAIERERAELERRVQRYRGDRPPLELAGRTVILVDDGIATGFTAIAGARALRQRGAARIVLAVPVGPPGIEERIGDEVDDVVCLETPPGFFAVGAYYQHFDQVSDEEVAGLLRRAAAAEREREPVPEPVGDPPRRHGGIDGTRMTHRQIEIPAAAGILLPGDLRLPPSPGGLVLFAHGSGSSRLSPRNVQVAVALVTRGFGTLLFDLLGEAEAADRRRVFDIPLLAERLVAATRWAQGQDDLASLPIGYFGASTGAAAALCAAADLGEQISALVSRGGRPDLAADRLPEVTAPTLLIVGGADHGVIELNEQAHALLRCPAELVVVPGATHLFEEPGALEQVAEHAADWFALHLPAGALTT